MADATTTRPASLLRDGFGHHVWATLVMIDACLPLTDEQLTTNAPGTYGPILDTFRHIVGADTDYLHVITDGKVPQIQEDSMSLAELRAEMVRNDDRWAEVLATDPDPDQVVTRVRDDGSKSHAPMGVRLTQAVQHGTDHRSQIATALTSLGIEPPDIDVWAYAWSQGRLTEDPAPG
jgi:uncharacterized damage-inducible protein DinB